MQNRSVSPRGCSNEKYVSHICWLWMYFSYNTLALKIQPLVVKLLTQKSADRRNMTDDRRQTHTWKLLYEHVSDKSKICLSVCLRLSSVVCRLLSSFAVSRSAILSYVWKLYHKNERHLCLVTHSFPKLSQNVCLINKYI